MLSPDLPVSRGQWQTLATNAIKLLGADVPATRLEATMLAVRLDLALAQHGPVPPLPEPQPF
jgi:hypothetical protein